MINTEIEMKSRGFAAHLLNEKIKEQRDALLLAIAYELFERESIKANCPDLIKVQPFGHHLFELKTNIENE